MLRDILQRVPPPYPTKNSKQIKQKNFRSKIMNMRELVKEIKKEQLQKDRQKKLTLAQEIEWFASIEGQYNTSENYFKGEYK